MRVTEAGGISLTDAQKLRGRSSQRHKHMDELARDVCVPCEKSAAGKEHNFWIMNFFL